MNLITIIGRVTKDTEINQTGKVASNTIAVDRAMKDADGNKVTDFINLRWLGEKKAQFAQQYITKGQKIAIEGSLCIDNYKDKEGNNKQFVYINVNNTEFCESKGSAEGKGAAKSSGDEFMQVADDDLNGLPF